MQREDVSEDWRRQVEKFALSHGVKKGEAKSDGPKFSHAWVVGGKRSASDAAVLVSDPQTPVRNPSLWMEFHMSGKTFNCRGVGVPGSPGLLIGFNRSIAWGLTALGADQADLFRLETSPDHPNGYRWNGEWRKMTVRTERIDVKGGASEEITVRETHLGPVVSTFAFQQPGDPEVALKRVPICDTEHETIQGALGMMRASSIKEFSIALAHWRFPSANCVYGSSDGQIGYSVLGAIPIRSPSSSDPAGNEALRGLTDQDDWRGFVPAELLPQSLNPKAEVLLSANHRPIGAFYPVPLGTSTGSMGDTIRSWRLRELLAERSQFTPEEVLQIHYDSVNPARREIVRLGLHFRKFAKLSEEALKALEVLEKWLAAGASSDLKTPGAELATRLSTFFRFVVTPLATKYGGGESGLARFLKDASKRINLGAKFEEEEIRFIDRVLSEAWSASAGDSRGARGGTAPAERLGWFESLDGFGSLDSAQDLPVPKLACVDGQTIVSQAAQSYTQWVPLHDIDSAQSICPIGHSDRPDSAYRKTTMQLWSQGKLHPAPISRKSVENIAGERVSLAP